MGEKMKFALCQIDVQAGLPDRNMETIRRTIEEARKEGAQVIIFPEMCVGGYMLSDEWCSDAVCEDLVSYNDDIRALSRGVCVMWGNVYVDTSSRNKDGRSRKFNAVYVAVDGEWAERSYDAGCDVPEMHLMMPAGVHFKTHLPNYRFFDDERYFFSLKELALDYGLAGAIQIGESFYRPFIVRLGDEEMLVGPVVCEDIWYEDYPISGVPFSPAQWFVLNGADVICAISASPWTFGKNASRDKRVKNLFPNGLGSPVLYVNHVGVQNNGKNIITFDGGTTAYDADGNIIGLAREPYKESILYVTGMPLTKFSGPIVERVERSKISQKYDAIIAGLKGMRETRGSDDGNYIIGMSGGVDSAVVAALLVQSVGPARVIGINMPTSYNSEGTKNAAAHVASELGIVLHTLPIQDIVDMNISLLEFDGKELSTLNEENVQAKIRGTTILSNLAAKYGGVFTNNGNKLEVALGYATLYGDWGGAISVIGDLTKVEVFEMAKHINDSFGREVIPKELMPDHLFRFPGIPPTAELKVAQIDPMKFGYHDALLEAVTDFRKKSKEDILRWFIDGTLAENLRIPVELLTRWGVDDGPAFVDDLDWFFNLLRRAVFKRVQSPPIIATSKSAYGFDIRESILPPHDTRCAIRLKVEARKKRKKDA